MDKLKEEKSRGVVHTPGYGRTFYAFKKTRPARTKVIILGDSPSPEPNISDGLCFSCYPHVKKLPRTTEDLIGEYVRDLKPDVCPLHGSMERWAENGVLMLNSNLTTRVGEHRAHEFWGWEKLIINTILYTSRNYDNISYVFLGGKAREFHNLVDRSERNHQKIVLPMPGKHNFQPGFGRSKLFSRINEYRRKHDLTPIDWNL